MTNYSLNSRLRIICTYWLSGRVGQENIWLEVRVYGSSAARSVPPDREPNIFPSGPTLLSQKAFYQMTTYCLKFWKFCFNLNRTRLHKMGRLRAEQWHESFVIYFFASSKKLTIHRKPQLIFSFLFMLKSQQKVDIKLSKIYQSHQKLSEWQKVASLKLLWRLTKMLASFQAICWAICRHLGFSYKTRENQQLDFNDTDFGFCKQHLGLLTLLALLV